MNFAQFAQSITPATTVTDVAATTPMWNTEKENAALAAQAAEAAEREARLAAYDPHSDPENPFRHLLPAPVTATAQIAHAEAVPTETTPVPYTEGAAAPDTSTPDQLRRIAETLRQQAHDLEAAAARIEAGN